MKTLEELAWKWRMDTDIVGEKVSFTFTLDQLRELIKEAIGSPVAYRLKNDGNECFDYYGEEELIASDVVVLKRIIKPLHTLNVDLGG